MVHYTILLLEMLILFHDKKFKKKRKENQVQGEALNSIRPVHTCQACTSAGASQSPAFPLPHFGCLSALEVSQGWTQAGEG